MFDRSSARSTILAMAARAENESRKRLGYREDEVVTDTERAFMDGMIRKKDMIR